MSLTIILVLLFSIVLISFSLRNKYHLFFIVMMVGMAIAMSTIIVEISKNSNYILPHNYFLRDVENIIYKYINSVLRIPLSSLLIIRNCGIVIYLTANIFFVLSFNNSILCDIKSHTSKKNIGRYVILSIFPLLYFILYHPNTAYWIYVIGKTMDSVEKQIRWFSFFRIVDILVIICTLLYLAYPIIYLISNYLRNRITFFSEQLLGLSVSLGLLNGTFFCMFFIGIFHLSVQTVQRVGFWRYSFLERIPEFYISYLPFVMSLILCVVLFIVIRFKIADIINGFKARTIQKNLNALYMSQRDILHSNKNLMLRIKILSDEAMNNYGTESGKDNIKTIGALCESNMNGISKTLDYIKKFTIYTMGNDFITAVENALEEISIPNDIRVTKNYQQAEVLCHFDMYHITQCLVNLINNSIDAIRSTYEKHKEISITVHASNNWVYCSISDTGCGIPKKLLDKVFEPYTSTKSKQNNWGLGLSYVFRIIKAHFGHIRFKSKPGKSTVVEILLPRSRPSGKKSHMVRD